MGYKLAGFSVLGGVEIDKKMADVYSKNHSPKYLYNLGISDFNKLKQKEIPKELYSLDVLDGSPPCSSFSVSGSREKKWGEDTYFREGQEKQILDNLFFDFLETTKKLKPKVVIAENVKGILMGKAKGYVKEILRSFEQLGYGVQIFVLNASRMGVPQTRERVFFIANNIDKKIELNFNEKVIPLSEAFKGCESNGKALYKSLAVDYERIRAGKAQKYFNTIISSPNHPASTLTAKNRKGACEVHWEKRFFSDSEIIRIQTFPDDYNFLGQDAAYICGMSVPPFMMQRLALEISRQFFNKRE